MRRQISKARSQYATGCDHSKNDHNTCWFPDQRCARKLPIGAVFRLGGEINIVRVLVNLFSLCCGIGDALSRSVSSGKRVKAFDRIFLKRFRLGAPALALCSALAVAITLPACTAMPDDPEERAEVEALNDPLEPMNRTIFDFNRAFDTILLRPVAEIYASLIPQGGQDMVKNFLDNLKAPVVLANDFLQGEPERAGNTAARFAANSTFGILGLFDISGIEHHNEDFGQTLGTWGLDEGPYLMLPFLGPSSARDGLGLVADYYIDPFNYYTRTTGQEYLQWVRLSVRAIDTRARNIKTLDEIERSAIDVYATYRSLYRQYRKKEILNGRPVDAVPMPQTMIDMDIEDDDEEEETSLLKSD